MPLEEEQTPIVENKRFTVILEEISNYQTALANIYTKTKEELTNINKEIAINFTNDWNIYEPQKAKITELEKKKNNIEKELIIDQKMERKKRTQYIQSCKDEINEINKEIKKIKNELIKSAQVCTEKNEKLKEKTDKINQDNQDNQENLNLANIANKIEHLNTTLNLTNHWLINNIQNFKNEINKLIEKYFIINNKNLSDENFETELKNLQDKIDNINDSKLKSLFNECKKILLNLKAELKKNTITSNDNIDDDFKKGQILKVSFKYNQIINEYNKNKFSHLISIETLKAKNGEQILILKVFAKIYLLNELDEVQEKILSKLKKKAEKSERKLNKSCSPTSFHKKLKAIEGYILISWENEKNEIIEGLIDVKNFINKADNFYSLLYDFNQEKLLDENYFEEIKHIIDKLPIKEKKLRSLPNNIHNQIIEKYFKEIDDTINNYCLAKDEKIIDTVAAIKNCWDLLETMQNLKIDEANSYLVPTNDQQKKPVMKM